MNSIDADADDGGDDLVFVSPSDEQPAQSQGTWKVLIVDDEPDVHTATKVALSGFVFMGREISFLHAYSGQQACDLLLEHPDTAVVYMDVVMESNDAGLRAVRRIREDLDKQMVRIILRTGQPGQAPEREVILNYGINEYLAKAELTSQKLYVSLVAALRSHHDLQTIETTRRGLMKILEAVGNMDFRSRGLFTSGLLQQLGSLLDVGDQDLVLIRRDSDGALKLLAAAGLYEPFVGDPIAGLLDHDLAVMVEDCLSRGVAHVSGKQALYPVPLPDLNPVALLLGGSRSINEAELALVQLFCLKIVLAHENYDHVEQSHCDQNAELALLVKVTGHSSYMNVAYATHRARLSREVAAALLGAMPAGSVDMRLPAVIERASMLIDIGNVLIPRALLDNPSPLSSADQAQIRQHPAQGAALLDQILGEVRGGRVMQLARQLILSHHEHFDGKGYPAGLSGSDIPLAARVVAVADTYMALTSARPWRPAFEHEQAVAMIAAQAGKHFDPSVVEAFERVSDAYREVPREAIRESPAPDVL